MVIFDANILITLSTEESGDNIDRISGLIADLAASKTVIGIPSPAWAEFLCGTAKATNAIVNGLNKRGGIRILPFDEVSAFETAQIHQSARLIRGTKKSLTKAPWQQVKVDRQILAIAKQHNVSVIYTDDKNMTLEAEYLGIETRQTSDIPLKVKQNQLCFDTQVQSPPLPDTILEVPRQQTGPENADWGTY